jgi:hypothetical protein
MMSVASEHFDGNGVDGGIQTIAFAIQSDGAEQLRVSGNLNRRGVSVLLLLSRTCQLE